MKEIICNTQRDNQHMTSLEIAELTGKQHKDVLKAIRNMEPAWEKTCGRKFALTSRTVVQPNGGTRDEACFSLTKTECLYIATKFNDEARAKLVIRWEELEREQVKVKSEKFAAAPLISLFFPYHNLSAIAEEDVADVAKVFEALLRGIIDGKRKSLK